MVSIYLDTLPNNYNLGVKKGKSFPSCEVKINNSYKKGKRKPSVMSAICYN